MYPQNLDRTASSLNLFSAFKEVDTPRTVEPESGPIFTLPHEIFVKILSMTPTSTLSSFASVCVQFSKGVKDIFLNIRSIEEIFFQKANNIGTSLKGSSLLNELLLVRNLTRNFWTKKVDYPFSETLSKVQNEPLRSNPTLRKIGTLYYFNSENENHFWNTPDFQKISVSYENRFPYFHKGSLPISYSLLYESENRLEYFSVGDLKQHTFVKIDRENKEITYVYYDFPSREQKSVVIAAKTLLEQLSDYLFKKPAKLFFYQVGDSLYLSTQQSLTCFLRLIPNPSPSLDDWRTFPAITADFTHKLQFPINNEIYVIGTHKGCEDQFRQYRLDGTLLFSENIAPAKKPARFIQGHLIGNYFAYLIYYGKDSTSLCLRELTSKKIVKEFKLPQISAPSTFKISMSAQRSLLVIQLKKTTLFGTSTQLHKTLVVSLLTERVIDLGEREYDDGYSHRLDKHAFLEGKGSFSIDKIHYRATIESAWASDSANKSL